MKGKKERGRKYQNSKERGRKRGWVVASRRSLRARIIYTRTRVRMQ